MSDKDIETELKIPVADLEKVRSALASLDARRIAESAREINLLLDTARGELADRGCVLRLRRFGSRRLLTFKGPPTFDGPIKCRTEHEVEIADLDRMLAVFAELGYTDGTRYEKDREVWRHGDVEVVLDHTPMGDFVEVEGPSDVLEAVTRSLGLDPSHSVRGSYLSLWRDYRNRNPEKGLPADMVFDQ